ncbi:MAG: glutamate synthase large subunit [Dehalococcoidia bacterium]|nr:glutamate synthase large subunit [Dehalococcoidia bacterium]MCB9485976.1 glutamate synthase large subunit [Thermoflexaceae bacterium]
MPGPGLPPKQGLYDPRHEHDSCGVGFVVHLKGHRSHKIVDDALTALENLAHRGASGSEPNTGDGAGVLVQIPDEFFRHECAQLSIRLPGRGEYGSGMLFAPPSARARAQGQALFASIVEEEGQHFLGWRDVPTRNETVGASALAAEPYVLQAFVGRGANCDSGDDFERRLYVIRRRFERALLRFGIPDAEYFYFTSLSSRTIVYKGMLTAHQVREYFPDLSDNRFISALGMFHSRFSTNTFPSWRLAHPYRMVSHNGEINTKQGNVNWMAAREALFSSANFPQIHKILPVIDEAGSDTACLDNAIELLVLAGRPIPHVMMMLIPEAWQAHTTMSPEKKAFYEYHSCLMEPWDGPASVAFTDGRDIGAVLDRNGLRPSRYVVTRDDRVIMASEVGVLPVADEDIVLKGRLEPGKMFLVSLEEGRIIDDAELKGRLAAEHPYADWLAANLRTIEDLPAGEAPPHIDGPALRRQQMAFGYTLEDLKYIVQPMAQTGAELIGSMGTDTPLAVLSNRPQPLYNYFKQLFAQVTNPPLDAIREELVTSSKTVIGPEGNLLAAEPESAHLVSLDNPFVDNDQLARFRASHDPAMRAIVISTLFPAEWGDTGLGQAMDRLFVDADEALANGAKVLILSDRGVDEHHAPIPTLLAVAGLHHHLVRVKKRTQVGLLVETGEAREVHHFALLIGYGAGAINPYLAIDTIHELVADGLLAGVDQKTATKNYLKAIQKGVIKVMSKMGISTIQSYRGAQIFEAIGLGEELIDRYFTKTASRIGGVGIEQIARETLANHGRAFPTREGGLDELDFGGQYQWRRDGEYHLFNPETVFRLQHATRSGKMTIFREYTKLVDDQAEHLATLRGLMEFKPERPPVPLDEVEPAEAIFRRFKTGAMSYGSISAEAHETLAIAMNRIGGKSNTGEGGEDRSRFTPDGNGDLRRSAIKQVASGRFGVTSEYLVNSDEIQIKMAQGAKPGEGGQLPGHKVYPWIADVRHATPGVGLISPPPHHDIYSIEDLAQLIHDLKNANKYARISVKLVAEVGVGTVAAGVAKAKSDVVLISGFDGGTGASPLTSLKHAGVPWELGLAETQQTLVMQNLRDRIVVEVDGQMKTGRDVVIGALLGGEEFGFATAPLVVMGCVMMRVCHLDTCPVGIATQNPVLREKFTGQAEHVVNFFRFIAEEVREYMAMLGFRTMEEMVGRSDMLDVTRAVDHWKAQGIDLSAILYRPDSAPEVATHSVTTQDHGLEKALDNTLIELAMPALERAEKVVINLPVRNVNRTVGTMLGSEVTRRYGQNGLPEDTIDVNLKGSAGQSFGAFVPSGITLRIEGDTNDYVGKGLSGGKLIVYPPRASTFVAEENILIGNVALYGATSGFAFFRGVAGERFAVRNSGAYAVVEGTGDHGCEYMTGGRVVVIGRTGRNFGAGMSGGVAYVWDPDGDLESRCNMEMIGLERLEEEEDLQLVHGLLQRHLSETGSTVAERLVAAWPAATKEFWKVMPTDYKRVLGQMRLAQEEGRELEFAELMRSAHG